MGGLGIAAFFLAKLHIAENMSSTAGAMTATKGNLLRQEANLHIRHTGAVRLDVDGGPSRREVVSQSVLMPAKIAASFWISTGLTR